MIPTNVKCLRDVGKGCKADSEPDARDDISKSFPFGHINRGFLLDGLTRPAPLSPVSCAMSISGN